MKASLAVVIVARFPRKEEVHKVDTRTNTCVESSEKGDIAVALALPHARGLSDEVLEAFRVRAIQGCELEFTRSDVAALVGVTQEIISRRWTACIAVGSGRPARESKRTTR